MLRETVGQVVIHIPFAESVHLRRITLKLGTILAGRRSAPVWLMYVCVFGVGRGESAPRQLRIYVNHSEIVDFEAVEYARPKLDIPLLGLEDEAGLIKVTFQSPAFSNVNTLSVFFVCLSSMPLECPLLSYLFRATPLMKQRYCITSVSRERYGHQRRKHAVNLKSLPQMRRMLPWLNVCEKRQVDSKRRPSNGGLLLL